MKGTSASAGIGIGKAAIVEETELVIKKETISDAAAEKERFHAALNQAMEETDALAKDLATRVGEKEAEILNGHLMLLSDPMLTGEIENTIAGRMRAVNMRSRMSATCMPICSRPWETS